MNPYLLRRTTEARSETPPMILTGTAIGYSVTADLGGFTEEIRAGAFGNLTAPDILFLAEHDRTKLLGRTGAGTLTLTDTPDRLDYRVALPPTEAGREAYALAERTDYAGASIGFRVEPGGDEWRNPPSGRPHRIVRRASLDHISPVSRPAHRSTVLARSNDRPIEIRSYPLPPPPPSIIETEAVSD